MAGIDHGADTHRVTIDLDHTPRATRPRRSYWLVALCVVCVLLGADLANRLTPRPAATPAPTMHSVVLTWTGDNPYTAFIGALNRAGMASDTPVDVPTGTIVVVIVVATRADAEVRCGITLDGKPVVAVNRSGLGAVAECVLPIRDRTPVRT